MLSYFLYSPIRLGMLYSKIMQKKYLKELMKGHIQYFKGANAIFSPPMRVTYFEAALTTANVLQ